MRRITPYLALYGIYFLAAVAITYPLITQIDTRLIGHPFGDAYEYVGLSWWIKTALQTGHDPFFQPLLLYPDGLPAPLLWSIPLQSFPTWLLAFFLPLTTAFNLSALLTLALNGLAMFALVQYLLQPHPLRPAVGSPSPHGEGEHRDIQAFSNAGGFAAFVSGVIWLAYPTFQGQLGASHTGLLTLWGAPLLVLVLLKLRGTDKPRRWMIAGALLFPVSLWGNLTLSVYLIAPLCVLMVVWAVVHDLTPSDLRSAPPLRGERGSERTPQGASLLGSWVIRIVPTLAVGVVLWLIFALPTLLDTSGSSPLQADGDVRYSAPLAGVVAPSFYHPLFTNFEHSRRALGVEPFETASYVGVIAAALCIVGLIRQRASRRWLALAAVAWVFSLGALLKIDAAPIIRSFDGLVTPISLPWAVFEDLPGLNFARTPARFNFAVGFAVAVMAGYGIHTLFSWLDSRISAVEYRMSWRVRVERLRILPTLVIAALILFEYQFWFPLPTVPGVVPDGIRTLSERGDIRAVFDIPFEHPLVSKEGMFLQTGHGLPILTGQITRQTPINPAKAALLQNTLDPALLDAAGVDAIIVHRQWENPDAPFALGDCCGDPIYEDASYDVYLVPPYEGDPPSFMSLAPENTRTTAPVSIYFYTPNPGGALLNASLTADGRDVIATLDDAAEPLARWTINGSADAALWVEFDAGFHTLTLALDPPCAVSPLPALTCDPLIVERLSFAP